MRNCSNPTTHMRIIQTGFDVYVHIDDTVKLLFDADCDNTHNRAFTLCLVKHALSRSIKSDPLAKTTHCIDYITMSIAIICLKHYQIS